MSISEQPSAYDILWCISDINLDRNWLNLSHITNKESGHRWHHEEPVRSTEAVDRPAPAGKIVLSIENGYISYKLYIYWWFTCEKWWCSISMLVYCKVSSILLGLVSTSSNAWNHTQQFTTNAVSARRSTILSSWYMGNLAHHSPFCPFDSSVAGSQPREKKGTEEAVMVIMVIMVIKWWWW